MHKKKDDTAGKRNYSQSEVEDAVAGLIASTRRAHRKLNLAQIAKKIEVAREGLGSLKGVAEAIGLSTEMLRQFARASKIAPEARRFVTTGAIQSVDIADRISRLPAADQLPVAQRVARGELTGDDVRAIISLRKVQPKLPMSEVISRVTGSRNVREYIVQFLVPAGEVELKDIEDRFSKLLGREGVRSVSVEKGLGTLILNKDGRNRLELIARRKRLTKRALVNQIVSGEVK